LAIPTHGDLVLDVVRAADPSAVEAARERLAAHAAGRGEPSTFNPSETRLANVPAPIKAQQDAFTKFEAMVLQTFIQSMLPQDTATVYGEGMAGEMWQSMLAEQIANSVAARGGIGIADRIIRPHYAAREQSAALEAENALAPTTEAGAPEIQSVALVQEIQRKLATSLNEDRSAAADAAF
jgi:flagellar protein FlgJ